jgi:23S rRNA (cytosine1962-C5)-methyltransferase
MTDERPTVRMRIERKAWHPWVFQKMVDRPPTRLPPGSVVEIVDGAGKWVGRGFYNGHSRIALRVLTDREDEPIDVAFFQKKITQAVQLRRELLRLDETTNAYRVVHSEGDGLSGLVVDRFGGSVVIEFFAAGMYRFREAIVEALSAHYPDSKFYWFADEHVQKQESIDCRSPEPLPSEIITEHGVKFRVTPGGKHKTGFFTDQRDNRRRIASMSAGKRVLDLCCNTGGFAVHAKVAGADEVTGIDLDETALALARQNAGLNSVRIRFVQSDLFPWLRDMIAQGQRWDVVVLDPAKQTRDREEVPLAIKKYLDMNRLAMQAVADGGIFATFSCTGLVSEADFIDAVRRAAWQAGRQLQLLHVGGAGGDHPVFLHAPESRYLKAVFARVYTGIRLQPDRPPEAEGASPEWTLPPRRG